MKLTRLLIVCVVLATFAYPQNGEIVPNENLVAEGIPKIPGSLADTVERYTNFRGAGFASWHPTRREMLIPTICRHGADSPRADARWSAHPAHVLS